MATCVIVKTVDIFIFSSFKHHEPRNSRETSTIIPVGAAMVALAAEILAAGIKPLLPPSFAIRQEDFTEKKERRKK